MRKKLFPILFCGLCMTMTACSNYSIPDDELQTLQEADDSGSSWQSMPKESENPFDAVDESGFLAAISHGAVNPKQAEDQSKLPFEYNGGEFLLEYEYSVTGKLDTTGFLLFLDGKPQPYKIDDGTDYEYCHIFAAKENGSFTFSFTPQYGFAGDTLNLTIISITNPDFHPDMVESTSYGWYHKTLEYQTEMYFNVDAPKFHAEAAQGRDIFFGVNIWEEKITSHYIESDLRKNGWDGISMEDLNNSMYYTAVINGEIVYDNICVTDADEFIFRFTLCGAASTEYAITFFLDHQPIATSNVLSYDVTLSKGNVWVLEAAIDASKLEASHTFYAMAVPMNSSDTAGVLPSFKSNSILLYKENIK